ncbi:MAG: hypothetical protein CMD02_04190 [Flavobacteriales bacterium]|nr:hypothetical protein [Flavobacteriales bacterium]|tara:strand:- start:163 stop:453 length:291 start_codon:yes stop_codon:yes gene_type:complete
MRKNGVNSLENILKKILNKPNLKKKLEETEVLNQIDIILGDNLKSYISNKYIKSGILYIHLSSSVLRNELSFQKESIIDNINRNIDKKIVKDIVFK